MVMQIIKKPFAVTPVYDILLRGNSDIPIGLYHLHLATAEQLCWLHYSPGSLTTVKARLLTLSDWDFVQSDGIPTRRGRSPYYYVLGNEGIAYLHSIGFDVGESLRASKETDKSYLHIQHTQDRNDVLIAAALLKRTMPVYYLDSFIHERLLKRKPFKGVWQGEKFTLIPDAFLDFRRVLDDGGQRRMPILLEHDGGTEEQRHFRQRIRACIMMLRAEAQNEWFGIKAVTIAFMTFEGELRREQMRDWTRRELTVTNEPKSIRMVFCFASMSQPLDPQHLWLEPCWYTPYDEDQPLTLLTGE